MDTLPNELQPNAVERLPRREFFHRLLMTVGVVSAAKLIFTLFLAKHAGNFINFRGTFTGDFPVC